MCRYVAYIDMTRIRSTAKSKAPKFFRVLIHALEMWPTSTQPICITDHSCICIKSVAKSKTPKFIWVLGHGSIVDNDVLYVLTCQNPGDSFWCCYIGWLLVLSCNGDVMYFYMAHGHALNQPQSQKKKKTRKLIWFLTWFHIQSSHYIVKSEQAHYWYDF